MAAVHPRRTRAEPARPVYVPTAVWERINRPVLPSDELDPWERRKLEARGIDRDFIDTLAPDVARVRMTLPDTPVPDIEPDIYRPNKS